MRLSTLLLSTTATAAGLAAARWLMGPAGRIERLPAPARPPLQAARTRLLAARGRAAEALRAGAAERDAAQRDLTREYHERAGRG